MVAFPPQLGKSFNAILFMKMSTKSQSPYTFNISSIALRYIGSNYKVDHDISLLIPEVWCRMTPEERTPERLIKNGELEKMEDFELDTPNGKQTVLASRLGYRITGKIVT